VRILLFAALLLSASCATNSGVPELEQRLSSWTGSPVHDLARELGEPAIVTEDSWEWRFTGPGMQASASTSSLSQSIETRDVDSSTGHASYAGIEGKTWTPFDASISRKECVYRAKISGMTIVEIEAVVVSGRCRFGEIPLQAKN
jgi:hypothetical protein